MKLDKLYRWAGFVILAGILLRFFEHPQGNLIFTLGFLFFFVLKLVKLFAYRVGPWKGIHTLDFGLIMVALAALILRYIEYPYSGAVFTTALLVEGLVSLRIKLNETLGSEMVSMGSRMLFNLLRARRAK